MVRAELSRAASISPSFGMSLMIESRPCCWYLVSSSSVKLLLSIATCCFTSSWSILVLVIIICGSGNTTSIFSPFFLMLSAEKELRSIYAFRVAFTGIAICRSPTGISIVNFLLIIEPDICFLSLWVMILLILYSVVYNREHFCICITIVGIVSMLTGSGFTSCFSLFVQAESKAKDIINDEMKNFILRCFLLAKVRNKCHIYIV